MYNSRYCNYYYKWRKKMNVIVTSTKYKYKKIKYKLCIDCLASFSVYKETNNEKKQL